MKRRLVHGTGVTSTSMPPIVVLSPMQPHQLNLSYIRHTGQWHEIYSEMSPDECLVKIGDEVHFGM